MKPLINRTLVMIAALFVIMTASVSAHTFGQVLVTEGEPDSSNFAEEVLELVNIERSKLGIAPLQLSEELTDKADLRAEEIVELFSHTRPDSSSCFTVLRGMRYNTCGENIAAGSPTPERVVEQWMDSQGHRENILNPAFKYLGVGYCYDENSEYTHYWVQLFIG